MEITVKQIDELQSVELLEIMAARIAVFVVEQNCPYQEIDVADAQAWHVQCKIAGNLVAYARIIDRGAYVTFGRVLVVADYRQQKLGQQLIQTVLAEIAQRFPDKVIKIAAQAYLQDFYGAFGFEPVSEVYLEDDIPHIDMLR